MAKMTRRDGLPGAGCWLWLAAWLCLTAPGQADEEVLPEVDDEYQPGLVATYVSGTTTVERIDSDIAFDWGEGSPDARLAAGAFTATWAGNILLRQPGQYRWHAYVTGAIRVTLDGRDVLVGGSGGTKPRWISGKATALKFGEQPLKVSYRRTGERGRVMLFWSSEHFPLEPLPAHLLFLPRPRAELLAVEQGRRLAWSHRCHRCHARENEPEAPKGPDLSTVLIGSSPEALVNHIVDPTRSGSESRMPVLGITRNEATAIVGWLAAHQDKSELLSPLKLKPGDSEKVRTAGYETLMSVGCLACHKVNGIGGTAPESGPELTQVGRRRTMGWLWTWLKEPARLNRDHRMPVFQLTDTERLQLVVALSALGKPASREPLAVTSEQRAMGEKLVYSAGCVQCHRVPGTKGSSINAGEAGAGRAGDLAQVKDLESYGCLSLAPDRKRVRPSFVSLLTASERKSIQLFVESRRGARLLGVSADERGRRLLAQKGCLACHERGTRKGNAALAGRVTSILEGLVGQSPALTPPALSAVGDKLHDKALADAVSGDRREVRMPWLRVKMPRFSHDESDLEALTHHLVSHDRIPDQPPATPGVAARISNDQDLFEAQDLVGFKGFSCIACHRFGTFTPKNVALGTRGSDLQGLRGRMRREYFLRWCREPLRIVPGMEMPSYKRPLKHVFGGDVERQLAAMWDALNDKRFVPPVNPHAVEQFLVVNRGEPARVVRDVFTLPESLGGGSVARSLAIGLPNAHSLLLDLDTGQLAAWTFGDFAKQRTQGKSWFWDLAGRPVITGRLKRSDLVMALLDDKGQFVEVIRPVRDPQTAAQLNGYQLLEDGGVLIAYRLKFARKGKDGKRGEFLVNVREVVEVTADDELQDGHSGWDRDISVDIGRPSPDSLGGWPRGVEFFVARPLGGARLGKATVTAWHHTVRPARPRGDKAWQRLPGQGEQQFARLGVQASGPSLGPVSRRILLRYATKLVPGRLSMGGIPPLPVRVEKVTSVPGYDGIRLPIQPSIMPTAMTWTSDGTLAFTSLKGHVYLAHDTDGDGLEDKLQLFEEGLAAPYGIIADGKDLIVAHKPEVLRLRDTDGDGRADLRHVVASGWGYSDDYHDWTCGIVRDRAGFLYVGLGSNYSQRNRKKETSLWRGKVLRISPAGQVDPVGHALRYPTGLAVDAAGRIYVSDNQGVQNTFNEINHLVPGRNYGVPSRFEEKHKSAPVKPAIHVPHPWSRSVNGLTFLPGQFADASVAGHGIGCEYDNRFLVRFTMQEVGGEMQGAVFHFSRPGAGVGDSNFVGPLSVAVSPKGDIYIGNIYDSGWLGGRNTGTITRLRPRESRPNGLRDLKAIPGGFEVTFAQPVDRQAAAQPTAYTVSGYTRVWKGGYSTGDSGRHRGKVVSAVVAKDGKSVRLEIEGLRTGHVYEVTCGKVAGADRNLWPATGHYSLHRMPTAR